MASPPQIDEVKIPSGTAPAGTHHLQHLLRRHNARLRVPGCWVRRIPGGGRTGSGNIRGGVFDGVHVILFETEVKPRSLKWVEEAVAERRFSKGRSWLKVFETGTTVRKLPTSNSRIQRCAVLARTFSGLPGIMVHDFVGLCQAPDVLGCLLEWLSCNFSFRFE
jgi:hypothetical protein